MGWWWALPCAVDSGAWQTTVFAPVPMAHGKAIFQHTTTLHIFVITLFKF
jgi:hypothetical protein